MKVSFLAPPHLRTLYSSRTDVHLALANELLYDPRLLRFYQTRSEMGEFVILDNGAYEQGQSIGTATLVSLANDIEAAEIVAPDILMSDASTATTLHGIEEIRACGWMNGIMVVPQSVTQKGWINNFHTLIQELGDEIDCIGIPKVAGDLCKDGTRYDLVASLSSLVRRKNSPEDALQIHLLGLGKHPKEMAIIERAFPGVVRSVDSKLFVKYGQHGIALHPIHGTTFPRVKGLPWRDDNLFPHIVEANIKIGLDWAKGR